MTRTGKGVALMRNPVQFTEVRYADQAIIRGSLPRADRVLLDRVAYGIPAICGFCGRMYSVSTSCVLTMCAIQAAGNRKIAPLVRNMMQSRVSGLTPESVAIECTCGMRTSFAELRTAVSRYVGDHSGARQKIGDR